MSQTLLIRADGSEKIGTGHVMRCLALAQAWMDERGPVYWLAHTLTPSLIKRLEAEGIRLLPFLAHTPGSMDDAAALSDAAYRHNAFWTVIDNYYFKGDYQERLCSLGVRHLAFDDNGHSYPSAANLLLNPNLHARAELHAGHARQTDLLLGPRYAPLRREFIKLESKSPESVKRPVQRLLISLGGADPPNRTLDVMRLIFPLLPESVDVRVIIGGCNPHREALLQWISRKKNAEAVVNADNMAEHYLWAHAAILPASTSCLEAFRCGLPSLLIASVENQREVAAHVRKLSFIEVMEAYEHLPSEPLLSACSRLLHDADFRSSQTVQMTRLVDGLGCRRIMRAMDLYGIRLETVTMDDAYLLWKWANDAEVRRQSFHQEPIPWEDHLAWMEEKLKETGSKFFIARALNNEAVGQIRLQYLEPGVALVHISVAPEWRGRGAGARMLRLVELEGFDRLRACVKKENTASLHLFSSAEFKLVEEKNGVLHFEKQTF